CLYQVGYTKPEKGDAVYLILFVEHRGIDEIKPGFLFLSGECFFPYEGEGAGDHGFSCAEYPLLVSKNLFDMIFGEEIFRRPTNVVVFTVEFNKCFIYEFVNEVCSAPDGDECRSILKDAVKLILLLFDKPLEFVSSSFCF